MARGGITLDQVKQARARLLAGQKSVSIDAIRIELGNTGSKTTIHRMLKSLELEDEQSTTPRTVSEEIGQLITPLAERLITQAQAPLDALRATHAQAETSWHIEREALEQTCQQQERALTTGNEEIAVLTAHIRTLEQDLSGSQQTCQALAQDSAILKSRLADKETFIASLEDKHRHARKSLIHFRDAMQTQRETLAQHYDQQIQQLQLQLRQCQTSLTKAQEQLLQSQHTAATLTTQNDTLTHQLATCEQCKEHCVDTIEELRAVNQLTQSELQSLQTQYGANCKALKHAKRHIATLEKRQYQEQRQWFEQVEKLSALLARSETQNAGDKSRQR